MNELTVKDRPQDIMKHTTDIAGICKEIVLQTSQNIKGKKYVRVEGWQAISTAHGCVASSRDVEKTETGFRAIGEIKRISDGVVIATAEGFVGDDESTWAQRPEYAKRAMAQTRSISRAARSAFAHVVVMMNAGLETTPAEEIPVETEKSVTKEIKTIDYSREPKSGKQWSKAPDKTLIAAYAFYKADAGYSAAIMAELTIRGYGLKNNIPVKSESTEKEIILDEKEVSIMFADGENGGNQ